ncbi:MAG: rhodanese-like domain-containing protein [Bacteroidetes bacterium]|nr:rhodanese-like domain-containing protein [Bacteroidota bacterium]
MTTSQILLLIFAALVIVLYVRRFFRNKNIKHYDPNEAAEKIKKSINVILLDVRTPTERKEQFIKGSFHIPLYELEKRIDELMRFKNKEIICYCRSGNRSLTAAAKLKKKGFNSANLKGGIIRWNHNNLK